MTLILILSLLPGVLPAAKAVGTDIMAPYQAERGQTNGLYINMTSVPGASIGIKEALNSSGVNIVD
jgi:hypothetical protein